MSPGSGAPVATVFARGPFLAGSVVILEEEEAHHLRVRRVPEGATIRLVDGKGGVATARLSIERQVLAARVAATTMVAGPPRTELLVGAGDRDRFLMLVEKATELGAESRTTSTMISGWDRRSSNCLAATASSARYTTIGIGSGITAAVTMATRLLTRLTSGAGSSAKGRSPPA